MSVTETNKLGYARVSTTGQNLDSQLDALKQVGCTRIYSDKVSGIQDSRPEWDKLLDYARPGDILVVTELSRMTRSLTQLLHLVKYLEERQLNIQSLRENIDTTSATGRAFISIMGAINQLERELKTERAAAGRAAAKARGKSGGRPRTDKDLLERARLVYENSDKTAAEVSKSFGIGRRTIFDYLASVRKSVAT